jgi:hypothetical protein
MSFFKVYGFKKFGAAANTDGIIHKLVTVFDSSCTKDKFVMLHVSGSAYLPAILILHRDLPIVGHVHQ